MRAALRMVIPAFLVTLTASMAGPAAWADHRGPREIVDEYDHKQKELRYDYKANRKAIRRSFEDKRCRLEREIQRLVACDPSPYHEKRLPKLRYRLERLDDDKRCELNELRKRYRHDRRHLYRARAVALRDQARGARCAVRPDVRPNRFEAVHQAHPRREHRPEAPPRHSVNWQQLLFSMLAERPHG